MLSKLHAWRGDGDPSAIHKQSRHCVRLDREILVSPKGEEGSRRIVGEDGFARGLRRGMTLLCSYYVSGYVLIMYKSGYQVEFLPLHIPSCAPAPPEDPDAYVRLNTEPILVTLTSWSATSAGRGRRRYPGEYLTSWYVGQIPKDAVCVSPIHSDDTVYLT